jgi:hypothetical protein
VQSYGLHRRTDLAGKRANELQIGRLQRVVAATLRHSELTYRLAVVSEGFGVDVSHRRTVFGSQPKFARPIGEVDCDVRQPQRLGHRLHHNGQDLARQHDGLHPRPQPSQHPGGVVAVAVHQPVHSALGTVAQRCEDKRGSRRGDRGCDSSGEAKPADQHRDKRCVPSHEDRDQGHVDQGPVGKPLDVEQPVPAQRNCDPQHKWQPGQPDRSGRQQLLACNELRQVPPSEAQHSSRDAAPGEPSQPAPGQRIATAPVGNDAQHSARHQRRCDHGGLAGVYKIEPAQGIGDKQRDRCHPRQHQRKGRRVSQCEHRSTGSDGRIVSRQLEPEGERRPPSKRVDADHAQVVQPEPRSAGRQSERRHSRNKGEGAPEQAGCREQQRRRRRLLRPPQEQRCCQCSQREDEHQVSPPGHQQRVRICAVDANRHVSRADPHHVVRYFLPQLRAPQAAQPAGKAMSTDLGHDVASLEPGTVDRAGYLDNHARNPIERDDGAISRCIESHRDSDHTEQHGYDRRNCRRPACEV